MAPDVPKPRKYKTGDVFRLTPDSNGKPISQIVSRVGIVEILEPPDSLGWAKVRTVDHLLGIQATPVLSPDSLRALVPFKTKADVLNAILARDGVALDIATELGARALKVLGRHHGVYSLFNTFRQLSKAPNRVVANSFVPIPVQQATNDLATWIEQFKLKLDQIDYKGLLALGFPGPFDDTSDSLENGGIVIRRLHEMVVCDDPHGELLLIHVPAGEALQTYDSRTEVPDIYPGEISITLIGQRELVRHDGSVFTQTSETDPVVIASGTRFKQNSQQNDWTGICLKFL